MATNGITDISDVIAIVEATKSALDRRDDEAPVGGIDDPYISQILTGHHVAIQRLCDCVLFLAQQIEGIV
jgi:hypothetical protein